MAYVIEHDRDSNFQTDVPALISRWTNGDDQFKINLSEEIATKLQEGNHLSRAKKYLDASELFKKSQKKKKIDAILYHPFTKLGLISLTVSAAISIISDNIGRS